MEYLKKIIYNSENLIVDFIAIGVSVLFLQIPHIFPLMGEAIHWERVIFSVLTGLFLYWITLYFFSKILRVNELVAVSLAIILGSIFWALSQSAYIIYSNWHYLSYSHPEKIYEENLWIVKYALSSLLIAFIIINLVFVVLFRVIKKIIKTIWTSLFRISQTQKL